MAQPSRLTGLSWHKSTAAAVTFRIKPICFQGTFSFAECCSVDHIFWMSLGLAARVGRGGEGSFDHWTPATRVRVNRHPRYGLSGQMRRRRRWRQTTGSDGGQTQQPRSSPPVNRWYINRCPSTGTRRPVCHVGFMVHGYAQSQYPAPSWS